MKNALIVSNTEKNAAVFTAMLNAASVDCIDIVQSCGGARRLLLDREFDLMIVIAPLFDESGVEFSRQIAAKGMAQVILLVEDTHLDAVTAACENDGVLTIPLPVNKDVFRMTLSLLKSIRNRITRLQSENLQFPN